MTPNELSALLNRQAESICQHLLPAGKRIRNEWCCGNVGGQPGKSLKIVLTGEKIGVWSDFEESVTGGDLLDLWRMVRGLSLYEAMQEAANHIHVQLDGKESRPKRVYNRPERPRNARKPQGKVMAYLQNRGLSEATLDDFQIGELDDQWVLFPYKRSRDGELINTKYLHLERINGKKQIRQEKEAEPCLFGWNALRYRYPDTRYVTITEGEIDSLSLHQCGIPSLSVPNGGGGGHKQDWIENDYDYLDQFDTIYLCLDNDPAGKEAEKEIIKRLGTERCRVVTLPYKDANECLMQGIVNFSDYFYKAKSFDPEELKSASLFVDAVLDKFYPNPGAYHGMKSPWEHFNRAMTFQREELIVWSGFSGSGKALSLETPIPTAFGWKKMGELEIGDFVFDENGNPCKVIALSEIMMNRPCYKVIFSDGCEIIADEEHEWLTDTIKSRQSDYHSRKNNRHINRELKKKGRDQRHEKRVKEIVTTRRISETLVDYVGRNKIDIKVNHSINVCGALMLPARNLPIEPYILGLWIGDGNSDGSGFTTADPEILDMFRKSGFEVTDHKTKYRYGIINGFRNILIENNLIKNKHIPDVYLRSSYFQRLSLLQGLMDTDGYAKESKCEFCTTNKDIAYKVLELTRTLGIRSYMVLGRAKLYEKDCGEKYRVMFTTELPVFRLKRKLDQIKDSVSIGTKRRYIVACIPVDSVPVRCIQVNSSSHLYLAGESMIPTHNSTLLNHVVIQGLLQGEKFAICSMEMPSKTTLWRMVRQITGEKFPSKERIREVMSWLNDKLWMVDVIGVMKVDRLMEVNKYAAKRYNIKNFVVDSLTKCGIREDDYDGQKTFIDQLCDFNHRYESTTHLVVHQRKPISIKERPDKFGVRGAAAITDEAHSVISVYRNTQNEEEPSKYKKKIETTPFLDQPDTILSIEKNRETGIEGKFNLYFDQDSLQFHEERQPPMDYTLHIRSTQTTSVIVQEEF